MGIKNFGTKSLIGLSLLTAVLCGCAQEERKIISDQCLRQELFQQCMKAVPAGPRTVGTSNDWDEVVSECGNQSRYMSYRKREFVKPECVSE